MKTTQQKIKSRDTKTRGEQRNHDREVRRLERKRVQAVLRLAIDEYGEGVEVDTLELAILLVEDMR